MVRTKSRKGAVRRAARTTVARPTKLQVVPPMTAAEAKARVEDAERRLARAGRSAARFARNSTREVMAAAQALREPMVSMLRTMRRAGRNIGRDARAAWHDMLPPMTARMPAGKM